jgi:hypothetical protein
MKKIVLSVFLALASCGGDDGPTLSDICNDDDGVFVLFYQKLFTCFPELGWVIGRVPAAADLSTACDGGLQPYLDDGTVKFNSMVDLAACRDYIMNTDCNAINDADTTPCDDLFVGTLEIGAECDGNDQCLGEAFCDKPAATGCGTCRAEKALGVACEEDFECASNFCHGQDNLCAERADLGEPCDAKDDCGGTRVCSPSSNTCVDEPTWAVGMPCRDFIDCDLTESGLYCDTQMGECRAFLGLGDTCGLATALCDFIHYEHCAQSGGMFTCQGPTTVSTEGSECNPFMGTQCASDMRCLDDDENEQTPSICVRMRELGEACNETDQSCDLLLECVNGECQYGNHTGECPMP